VEWWNGGMVEWGNGGMAEWRNGGMAEWHNVGYEIVWNQDRESTQMPPWQSPSRLVLRQGRKVPPAHAQRVWLPVQNYKRSQILCGPNIPRHTVPMYIYSKFYVICTLGKCQLSFLRAIKFILKQHRN
jgi:hypothetical protein